jgi:hypothetical protein
VGNVADVSDIRATSVFRDELSRVGEFLYMYSFMLRKNRVDDWGLMPRLGQQEHSNTALKMEVACTCEVSNTADIQTV